VASVVPRGQAVSWLRGIHEHALWNAALRPEEESQSVARSTLAFETSLSIPDVAVALLLHLKDPHTTNMSFVYTIGVCNEMVLNNVCLNMYYNGNHIHMQLYYRNRYRNRD